MDLRLRVRRISVEELQALGSMWNSGAFSRSRVGALRELAMGPPSQPGPARRAVLRSASLACLRPKAIVATPAWVRLVARKRDEFRHTALLITLGGEVATYMLAYAC